MMHWVKKLRANPGRLLQLKGILLLWLSWFFPAFYLQVHGLQTSVYFYQNYTGWVIVSVLAIYSAYVWGAFKLRWHTRAADGIAGILAVSWAAFTLYHTLLVDGASPIQAFQLRSGPAGWMMVAGGLLLLAAAICKMRGKQLSTPV